MQRWSRPLLNTGVSMETIIGGLPASRSRESRITGASRVSLADRQDDPHDTDTEAIPPPPRGAKADSTLGLCGM
jgi:hypothetical protein